MAGRTSSGCLTGGREGAHGAAGGGAVVPAGTSAAVTAALVLVSEVMSLVWTALCVHASIVDTTRAVVGMIAISDSRMGLVSSEEIELHEVRGKLKPLTKL